MRESIEKLQKRSEKAWAEVEANRSIWEDCYEFHNPFRNSYDRGDKTHKKPTRVYDSTSCVSAQNFVNTMSGKFTPVFSRWAELKAGLLIPQDQKKGWDQALEVITDTLVTYRNNSNFYTARSESYFELGIGTAPTLIIEGDELRPFIYVPLMHGGYAIEDGKYGEVGGLYRKHKVKLRLIKEMWKGAKLPASYDQILRDRPDEERDICEAFCYDYDEFVWRQEVWIEAEKESIFDATYQEQPFTCPRWMKVPGMATGIGPFVMAMADVKTLNKMKELQLQMAALSAFGVYAIKNQAGINPNNITIGPGRFIPLNDPKNDIQRFPDAGNFQIQEYMLDDLKTQIRQVMLDNRLPAEKFGQGTAYEVAQRLKELQTDIGAAFGRLIYEDVQPLHRREISILAKKGLIKLPEGFAIDNLYVSVNVVSPIAQEQKHADVQKFVQAYQISAGVSPELAMMSFKVEDVPEWVADQMGVPPSLMRTPAEKKKIQEAAAQAAQAAAQQEVKQ